MKHEGSDIYIKMVSFPHSATPLVATVDSVESNLE